MMAHAVGVKKKKTYIVAIDSCCALFVIFKIMTGCLSYGWTSLSQPLFVVTLELMQSFV